MADRKLIIEIGKEGTDTVVWACRAKQKTCWEFEIREYMGEPFYMWGNSKDCITWIKDEFSLEDGEESEILFLTIGEDCFAIASEIKREIETSSKILISCEKQDWSKALEEYLLLNSKLVAKGTYISEINSDANFIKVGKLKVGFQKLGNFEFNLERKASKSNNNIGGNKKPEKSPDVKVEQAENKKDSGSNLAANTKLWKPGQKSKSMTPDPKQMKKPEIASIPKVAPVVKGDYHSSITTSEDVASVEDNELAFLARIEQQKTEV